MISIPLTPKLQKMQRPTREEMADALKKLRDAAANVPNLDSGHPWSKTLLAVIEEADAIMLRRRTGGYYKKTDVCHERIRKLAPVIYERMNRGDKVAVIARELQMNRTTVRNWYKKEKRRLALGAGQS